MGNSEWDTYVLVQGVCCAKVSLALITPLSKVSFKTTLRISTASKPHKAAKVLCILWGCFLLAVCTRRRPNSSGHSNCTRTESKIYLHAFLDGRDTPPASATASLQKFEALFNQLNCGQIVSVIGRYYAMDRDNRWERTAQAYQLIVTGEALSTHTSALEALNAAYAANETDEFVKARNITNSEGETIKLQAGDSLVFMNFRADRARQLTAAFIDPNFTAWPITHPQLSSFLTLTHYADELQARCMFAPETIKNGLGEVLANTGKPNYAFQKQKSMPTSLSFSMAGLRHHEE